MKEQAITKRKGARRIKDIPPAILEQLNKGDIETANLMECLAIDFAQLLQNSIPKIPKAIIKQISTSKNVTWLAKVKLTSQLLYDHYGISIIEKLAIHPADNIRGLAAGIISLIPHLSLKERLTKIKPIADDAHFGVRETAWLLLREHIATDIKNAIHLFQEWIQNDSANIRRFAVESTRPRGVWCCHISQLKTHPELGLPLLNPLHGDPSRYVQDSVANWLNDAAKTNAVWVIDVCKQWQAKSNLKATEYICKRALRNC